MAFPVHIVRKYSSRYDLLGTMAGELADAFGEHGCPVNPPQGLAARPGLCLFLNFAGTGIEAIAPALDPASGLAVVQYVVDHPLAMPANEIERFARSPNYRLALCAPDGLHLAASRFGIEPVLIEHGVPRSALCPAETITSSWRDRSHDVVVMGSIAPRHEVEALEESLGPHLAPASRDIAQIMIEHPRISFETAADAVLGRAGVRTGSWEVLQVVWRAASTRTNRERRLRAIRELEGLPVTVFGGDAWAGESIKGVTYAGELPYSEISRALMNAKVSIAWGPTQFAHGHSERLLLSMAAGCTTIADDRLSLAPRFDTRTECRTLDTWDWSAPGDLRRVAEEALAREPDECIAQGVRGRNAIEAGHLWIHRTADLTRQATAAIQSGMVATVGARHAAPPSPAAAPQSLTPAGL